MTRSLESLTEALLSAARRAGADAADALAVEGTSLSIDIRAGALEQAERSESIELGLRVLVGYRQACVSVSDISQATIDAVAERAVAMAREAPEDPWIGLADADQLARTWDVAALELSDDSPEPGAQALEQDARRAEAAAMAVSGITQVEASAGYGARRMHIAASKPKSLDASGVSADLIDTERRIAVEKAREAGKPENMLDKIAEGSVQKFLKEVTLLGQVFVKAADGKQTIEQLLKSKGASVSRFVLYLVGEGIEKKSTDFAAEVAAQAAAARG